MSKPQNHVTRRIQEMASSPSSARVFNGYISPTLLKELEDEYPPRCKRIGESEENHQRYAGKVELVQALKQHLHIDDDLSDEDILSTEGERAS